MIRLLCPSDAEHAAWVIRHAFATLTPALDPPPSALGIGGHTVAVHIASGGGGALADQVGCLLWLQRDDSFHLSRLAVLPRARGHGLASALLAYAEAVARAAGAAQLRLEVRLALADNRRLFRRAGFVEGERRSHPGCQQPTYVLAKKRL